MTYKNYATKKPTTQLPITTVHEGHNPIACQTLFQRIDDATEHYLSSSEIEADLLKQRYQVLFIEEKKMVCRWCPEHEKRTPSYGRLKDGQFVITANLQGGRRVGVFFLRKLSKKMEREATGREVFLRRSKSPHALWLFWS